MLKRVIARLPDETVSKLKFCVGKLAVKKMYGVSERMLSQEQVIAIAIEMMYEMLSEDSVNDQKLKGAVFDVVEHFNMSSVRDKEKVEVAEDE